MSQQDRSPVRVLVDGQHGGGLNFDAWRPIAQRIGFALADEPVTAETLATSRALVVCVPNKEIAFDVRRAVVDYVRAGGSMLVVMDEERRQSVSVTGVNDLIRPFGMIYAGDTPYLHNCGAVASAGTINRARREVPYSGGRAVDGGTPFAWRLDLAGRPAEPYGAFTEVTGGGRIVVLAEAMAALLMGTREGTRLSGINNDPAMTTYWGKDSATFMGEIMAWLLRREEGA
jgi:hypothetical protein